MNQVRGNQRGASEETGYKTEEKEISEECWKMSENEAKIFKVKQGITAQFIK